MTELLFNQVDKLKRGTDKNLTLMMDDDLFF